MDLDFVLVIPAECLTMFVRSIDDYNYDNLAYLIVTTYDVARRRVGSSGIRPMSELPKHHKADPVGHLRLSLSITVPGPTLP